jgi:hypothetical protein
VAALRSLVGSAVADTHSLRAAQGNDDRFLTTSREPRWPQGRHYVRDVSSSAPTFRCTSLVPALSGTLRTIEKARHPWQESLVASPATMSCQPLSDRLCTDPHWMGGRVVDCARLESVCSLTGTQGSNPCPSELYMGRDENFSSTTGAKALPSSEALFVEPGNAGIIPAHPSA